MKGESMATVKQLQFRLRNAKKTLQRLNKDLPATKTRIKKLESLLSKATAAEKAAKAKKKEEKVVAKRRPAAKKKTVAKKRPAAKRKRAAIKKK